MSYTVLGSSVKDDELMAGNESVLCDSDDEKFFIPARKTKMIEEADELPKICFISRSSARERYERKRRKRHSEHAHRHDNLSHYSKEKEEKKVEEARRIPPLPDLASVLPHLYGDSSQDSISPWTPKSGDHQNKLHPLNSEKKIAKKRNSIEMLKSKSNAILGDLFAVNTSSDSDCQFIGFVNREGEIVKSKRKTKVEEIVAKQKSKCESKLSLNDKSRSCHLSRNQAEGCLKLDQVKSKSWNLSGSSEVSLDSKSRSRNSSGNSDSHASDVSSVLKHNLENSKGNIERHQHRHHSRNNDQRHVPYQKSRSSKSCEKNIPTSSSTSSSSISVTKCDSKTSVVPKLLPKKPLQFHRVYSVDNITRSRENSDIPLKRSSSSDFIHSGRSSQSGVFDILSDLQISPRSQVNSVKDCSVVIENLHLSTNSLKVPLKIDAELANKLKFSLSKLRLTEKNSFANKDVTCVSETEDKFKLERHFLDIFPDRDTQLQKQRHVLLESDLPKHAESIDKNMNDKVEDLEDVCIKESRPFDGIKDCIKETEPLGTIKDLEENSSKKPEQLDYTIKSDDFSDISEDEEEKPSKSNMCENVIEISSGDSECDQKNPTVIVKRMLYDVITIESDTAEECEKNSDTFSREGVENVDIVRDNDKFSFDDMPILERIALDRDISIDLTNDNDEELVLPDLDLETDFDEEPADIVTPSIDICKTESNKMSLKTVEIQNSKTTSIFGHFRSPSLIVTKDSSSLSRCPLSYIPSPKCSTPTKSRKRKVQCNVKKSSSNTPSDETRTSYSVMQNTSRQDETASSMLDKHRIEQICQYMDFLYVHENNNEYLPQLPEVFANLIHGCEDEGQLKLEHALYFVEKYSFKYTLPSDIFGDVIKSAFLCIETELEHTYRSYKLLLQVSTKHPGLIHPEWDLIQHCLRTTLVTHPEKSHKEIIQASLLLKLSTHVLKTDLYSKDITDVRQIRKSLAYRMLSYDVSTVNRKELIYYVNLALHAGEGGEMKDQGDGHESEIPRILPILLNLLALCVDVSSSCVDCSNALASELVTTYIYMPSVTNKHLLLQSITSDLMCFKLIQLILERQYSNTLPLCGFPDSLQSVIQCFFKAVPLVSSLTPPTTPSDDLAVEEELRTFYIYTQENTEEIAMLLYYIVKCYLQVSYDNSSIALRRRVHIPAKSNSVRSADVEELQSLPQHVASLEERLCGMTADLTPNTHHYLLLLLCLAEHG